VATLSIGLFFGMLICLEVGHRIGRLASARDARAHKGLAPVEAAIFALLGLLLGFAFAEAISRFDNRRQLIIQEANAITSAYFRLDLLVSDQESIRRLFREYLDTRIRVYDDISDDERESRIAEAAALQRRIWERAVMAGRADPTENTGQVVLPAINEMIDVTTARTLALRTRLATLILVLLCIVALLSALIAGYTMGTRPRRSVLHMVSYAACVALTVYTVLDLDNPRRGLIRLAPAEALLEDLRNSIHD
jgi:hypothetical protein